MGEGPEGARRMKNDRQQFQFSNATAQRAEAKKNASEALAFLERWAPASAPERPEPEQTTAAGTCFRRVSAILAGRGK